MRIDTLMWLLPIAFMIHDFEEIILSWPDVVKWTIISLAVILVNLIFVHALAGRFEKWLDENFAKS